MSHHMYTQENEKDMNIQHKPTTYMNQPIYDQEENSNTAHNLYTQNQHTQRMTNYKNETDERTPTQTGGNMYLTENTYNFHNTSSTKPFVNSDNNNNTNNNTNNNDNNNYVHSNKNRNIGTELKSVENNKNEKYNQKTFIYGYINQEREKENEHENEHDHVNNIYSDKNEYTNRPANFVNEKYSVHKANDNPTVPFLDYENTKSYEQSHTPNYVQNSQNPNESNNLVHDKRTDEKGNTFNIANSYHTTHHDDRHYDHYNDHHFNHYLGEPSKNINNLYKQHEQMDKDMYRKTAGERRHYNEQEDALHTEATSVSKEVAKENVTPSHYNGAYNFYQQNGMTSPIKETEKQHEQSHDQLYEQPYEKPYEKPYEQLYEQPHEQMKQRKLEQNKTERTQGNVPEYAENWEHLQRVPVDKVNSLDHLNGSNEQNRMNILTHEKNLNVPKDMNSQHYQHNKNSPNIMNSHNYMNSPNNMNSHNYMNSHNFMNSPSSINDSPYQYNKNIPNGLNSPNVLHEESLRPTSFESLNGIRRDANFYRAKNMSHSKIFDYVDTYNNVEEGEKRGGRKKKVDTFIPKYSNLSARETLYKNLSGNDSITILAANKMDFDRVSQQESEASLPNVYPFNISEQINKEEINKQKTYEKGKNSIKLLPVNFNYINNYCTNKNTDISLAQRRHNMNSSHIFDTIEMEEKNELLLQNGSNCFKGSLNYINTDGLIKKEEIKEQNEYNKEILEKEEKRKMNPMYSDLFGRSTPDSDITKIPKDKLLSTTMKNNWIYHASDVKKYEDKNYDIKEKINKNIKNSYEQNEYQEPDKFYRKSYFNKDGYDNTKRLKEALTKGSKVSLQAHLQSSFQNEMNNSYKKEDFFYVETFYLTLYNLKDTISDETIKQIVKNCQAHLVSYNPEYDLLSNKRKSTAKMCIRHNKGKEGLKILEDVFSQMQIKIVAK